MSNFNAPVTVIPSPQGNPVNGNSMSGNIISSPTLLYLMSKCSYAFVWTGTSPVGAISIQGSNDFTLNNALNPYNPGTWNTLTFNYNGSPVTSVPVTGNTGNGIIDLTATGIWAVRCVYTATSGSGALTATFCSKAG
jgi:hypothetical protein